MIQGMIQETIHGLMLGQMDQEVRDHLDQEVLLIITLGLMDLEDLVFWDQEMIKITGNGNQDQEMIRMIVVVTQLLFLKKVIGWTIMIKEMIPNVKIPEEILDHEIHAVIQEMILEMILEILVKKKL